MRVSDMDPRFVTNPRLASHRRELFGKCKRETFEDVQQLAR